MVILGLYAFIVGLEMGLFPIGETIAFQLTAMNNNLIVYLFAFLIGFSTTMAEPSLLAIAIKAVVAKRSVTITLIKWYSG